MARADRLLPNNEIDPRALYELRCTEDAQGCAWVACNLLAERIGEGRCNAWWHVAIAFGARVQDARFDAARGSYLWPMTEAEREALAVMEADAQAAAYAADEEPF